MHNHLTVIAVSISSTSNINLRSYPILEQDDIIHVDTNNNNNIHLKAKVIINKKCTGDKIIRQNCPILCNAVLPFPMKRKAHIL